MRAVAAALAAVLLAACASTPPVATGGFTSGRLTVHVDASPERTAQSLSAGFELQGTAEHGELRLMSPLGTQLASARWTLGEAVLTTPQGAARYDDLSELSRQALGEDVPLAALPDWLAGRPWAGAAHAPQADGFEQLGWQVVLTRRAAGWIEARRAATPAVSLRVRLDGAAP